MSTTCEKDELINLLKAFVSFKSVDGEGMYKTECLDWIQTAFLSHTTSTIKRGDFICCLLRTDGDWCIAVGVPNIVFALNTNDF